MLLETELLCIFPQGPFPSQPGVHRELQEVALCCNHSFTVPLYYLFCISKIIILLFNGTKDLPSAQGKIQGSLGYVLGSFSLRLSSNVSVTCDLSPFKPPLTFLSLLTK